MYSVRSGYRVALGMEELPGPSDYYRWKSWWDFLWKCCIPNKIKIFFWKAFHGWLPTATNFGFRHVQVVDRCVCCNGTGESSAHIFWFCKLAKSFWKQLLGVGVFYAVKEVEFSCIVIDVFAKVDRPIFELFVLAYWSLWTNKNNLVHGAGGWDAKSIADWVLRYRAEYHNAVVFSHKDVISCQPIFVHRGANSVAHELTQLALFLYEPHIWMEEVPASVVLFVLKDGAALAF
ncbi:hypothetical protein Dsin_007049 [Dipteronia sinensis]|uniref:Reverse transcriptase zinc-binding domain-containing protein n=1 Tax=Dipteronia sinensis TaxID=43782 RepID=A0AAE0B0Q0_9ROSI|nr:hypothetical protein Dsin_007049 [Dipteronia sinensis]